MFEIDEEGFNDFEVNINNNRRLLLNYDNIYRKEWGNCLVCCGWNNCLIYVNMFFKLYGIK